MDKEIVTHHDGEFVRLAMAAATYRKLEIMLGGFDAAGDTSDSAEERAGAPEETEVGQ
jgi:hypothetical protein